MTTWDTENTRAAVIRILGKHIDPMRAQLFLTNYCADEGIPMEEFSPRHVAKFTLHLATHREDFDAVPDGPFNNMLNELVRFSNAGTDGNDAGEAPATAG